MQERTNKSNLEIPRASANEIAQNESSGNSSIVDNRTGMTLQPFQLKATRAGGVQVIQREYASSTASAIGATVTKTSKGKYQGDWVTKAMNQIASVKPKKVPNGEGGQKTVVGNAKFQCAEPKSLSGAVDRGLDADEKVTKQEIDAIRLKDIKWCTGDRDGQAACLCPTCATWLEEDGAKGKAKPKTAAKNKVKEIGLTKGLYFENDVNREKQRKKEKAKAAELENYGVYIEAMQDEGVTELYHEIRDLITDNRDQFERFLECVNEITDLEDEILHTLEEGSSKEKKKARDHKAACLKKIETLESEKSNIISSLGLNLE